MLLLYHFSCTDVSFYFLVHCTYSFFSFLQYLSKIQICAYFYVHLQNLMKIGQSVTKLLHIFDFQNGDLGFSHFSIGCLPSWIWYDIIFDHPRLVFDGLNILLKLHIDHFYTLQDITIFKLGPFGL